MTSPELISKFESKIRPYLVKLNPWLVVYIYSSQKKVFLKKLTSVIPKKQQIGDIYKIRLWGIKFNCGLMNAAGMFKNGEGYNLVSMQGAGGYLAGTTTSLPRIGNIKNKITHPFAPYPNSNASSNWMGLPNDGHEEIAKRLSKIDKKKNCPVGASISASPEQFGRESLEGVVNGLNLYDKANVDFIELNESCPNVAHSHSDKVINGLDADLVERLEYIKTHFLVNRNRNLPVIVKLSNDTSDEMLEPLIGLLIELGFDGINLGNTSTKYVEISKEININDKPLFDYFTKNYGGGISGKPLKNKSLELVKKSNEIISTKNLTKEFNIIRTGGIDSFDDYQESLKYGVKLNQWYTGYFSNFSKVGNNLYSNFFSEE